MIQTRQAVSDCLTSAQAAMARCQRLRGIVLRIVLVLHSHIVGGIERHDLSLMQGLRERGHEVAFAGPLDGWLGRAATAQGFTVLHLPMRGYYDLPSLIRLVRFARHYRAELLHGHSQRGSHYAGWAARLGGLPSLATAHSPKSWKYFGVADRIIAVSVSVRDMLVRRGRALARIEVVYNGVPDLVREPGMDRPSLRAQLGLPEDAFAGLIVARLVRQKGQDLAARLLAEHPRLSRLRILIAGDDRGDWADYVKDLATDSGVRSRLHFIGERSDIGALMRAADFVFAPSRQEAFGLTLAEAGAMSRPVIATSVDGIPEVVVDGHSGLLVPVDDVAAMAAAVERLMLDAALRRRLGEAGRRRYETHFTVGAMVDNTLSVYARVCATGRGTAPAPRWLAWIGNPRVVATSVKYASLMFAVAESLVQ